MTCNTDGTPNYTSAKYLVQKDPATITLADGSTVSGTLIETDLSAGFVYVDGTSSMVFQKDLGTRGTGIVTGITRDRKSVVKGKRVDLGGRRSIKKNTIANGLTGS